MRRFIVTLIFFTAACSLLYAAKYLISDSPELATGVYAIYAFFLGCILIAAGFFIWIVFGKRP